MANGEKDERKSAAGTKGAIARRDSLTSERRSQISRDAALARWNNNINDGIPRAVNEGILKIGDVEIDCAVLDTGTRLISQSSFLRALARSRSMKGGTGTN